MKFRNLSLAAALLVTAGAFAGFQEVQIKWAPKAGTVYKYKMSAEAKNVPGPAGPATAVFGMTLTRNIKEIKEEKVYIEEKQEDFTITLDGQDVTGGMEIPKITTNAVYDMKGKQLERKSDAQEEMDNKRLEAAMDFTYPDKALKIGDTWTITSPGDKEKGVFATEKVFKYVGTEMVGETPTFKIEVNYKETEGDSPMSGTGTMWLLPVDGELFKGAFELKNVEFGPAGGLDVAVKIDRA